MRVQRVKQMRGNHLMLGGNVPADDDASMGCALAMQAHEMPTISRNHSPPKLHGEFDDRLIFQALIGLPGLE